MDLAHHHLGPNHHQGALTTFGQVQSPYLLNNVYVHIKHICKEAQKKSCQPSHTEPLQSLLQLLNLRVLR